jgi:UDP-N-acetylglucosamine transferase subunit ALG13
MKDPTQVFAYELADHIVAHFPASLEQADYQFAFKTFYSGYISQYAGRERIQSRHSDLNNITVLLGYDNYDTLVLTNITKDHDRTFTIIGNKREYDLAKNCTQLGRVSDISKAIAGEIVISAAGQNTIAELFSLGKRLILLPEPRPYDEQVVHADVLADQHVVLMAQETFTADQWQEILRKATSFKPAYNDLVNASAAEDIAKKMRDWYA